MHLLFVIVIVGQISDDLTLIKPLQLWHNHCFWMNHIEHKPPWNLRQMCNYASFSKEMQMHIVATNGPSSLLLLDTRRPKSRRAKHSWMFIHCVKTRLTLLIKEVNSQVFHGVWKLQKSLIQHCDGLNTVWTKSNILVGKWFYWFSNIFLAEWGSVQKSLRELYCSFSW